ncbi:MAG: adenylate/guanylate cyclase domain-containing protein [Spirochaetota bacterium]
MKTKSLSSTSLAELEQQLDSLESLTPSLAIVFLSDRFATEDVRQCFHKRSIQVFGANSIEEIENDTVRTDSIAVLLFEIAKETFSTKTFLAEDSFQLGKKVTAWAKQTFSNPQIIISAGGGGINVLGDDLIRGLFADGKTYPVFGGFASAQTDIYRSHVFNENLSLQKGVVVCVFDGERIQLEGIAISGWLEIGTPKIVTKSSGNYVYEMDNEPVIDIYKRYFKIMGSIEEQLLVSEYPISIHRENGERIMRVAVSIDEEKQAIHYGGPIAEGTTIRFCSPNIVRTLEHTIEQLHEFQLQRERNDVDAVLIFDCAIRSRSFGSYMQKEIRCIRQLWQAPLVGFSSWGEIGSKGAGCDFYHTTIALVLVHEVEPCEQVKCHALDQKKIQSILAEEEEKVSLATLQKRIDKLEKEKAILSNFLHLTSDDLDNALKDISLEREKSENLLLNILPVAIAERLKKGESQIADSFVEASILFADIVGFTELSSQVSPQELVRILNELFTEFDTLTGTLYAEKIKTIGDAYMVVAGLPVVCENHAEILLQLAEKFLQVLPDFNAQHSTSLNIRIGINSGPVVAGVIGTKKISYDLWGDAVNTASRMESSGQPGKIHVSQSTYERLKDQYKFVERGEIQIKGKGLMKTYFHL